MAQGLFCNQLNDSETRYLVERDLYALSLGEVSEYEERHVRDMHELVMDDLLETSSPCPSEHMTTAMFPPFSRLPAELRLRIWRHTFPRNRRVSLDLKYYFADKGDDFGYHTPYTYAYDLNNLANVPIALHVCYESRQETLKHYRVITRPEQYWDRDHHNRRFPFTFNPILDTAQLEKYAVRWGVPVLGHKRGCIGLLTRPSEEMRCCNVYLGEDLSCGAWDALLEKYAPGLLTQVQSVFVNGIDWDETARGSLQSQIADRPSELETMPNPQHAMFAPLLRFTKLSHLLFRVSSYGYIPVVTPADMVALFREFFKVHQMRSGISVTDLEIESTTISLSHRRKSWDRFQAGLEALKEQKLESEMRRKSRRGSWELDWRRAESPCKRRRLSSVEISRSGESTAEGIHESPSQRWRFAAHESHRNKRRLSAVDGRRIHKRRKGRRD